jgi:hypothetical protein
MTNQEALLENWKNGLRLSQGYFAMAPSGKQT